MLKTRMTKFETVLVLLIAGTLAFFIFAVIAAGLS